MGIWDRLTAGLRRTQEAWTDRVTLVFERVAGETLDDTTSEELEAALLASDLGPDTTEQVLAALAKRRGLKGVAAWREALAEEIARLLERGGSYALKPPSGVTPWVVLVVGVNGVGKTTMIGKLAARERAAGRRALVVAADTFRAAAADQLSIWAARAGAELVRTREGADPAAVAFDGIEAAKARGLDTVIVDTAGRLHTKTNLMDELAKVRRVMGRALAGAPHATLLALDATLGQNTLAQAREFQGGVGVDALLLSKLDGTAKGGAVVTLVSELGLPVALVGVGEKLEDWSEFDGPAFARALVDAS